MRNNTSPDRARLTRLYEFAYRISGDPRTARLLVQESWPAVADWIRDGRPTRLPGVYAAVLETFQRRQPATQMSFELLDQFLRGEPTGPTPRAMGPSAEELQQAVWDLQQVCLTSTLVCLGPAERFAFALSAVAGLPHDVAAQVLGISKVALRVRLSRATTKLEGYLGPRCSLVLSGNPCSCVSRARVLLRQGQLPEGIADPEASAAVELPRGDVAALYAALPPPAVPEELLALLQPGRR